MKMNVNGMEVKIKDKIADTFAKISRPLTSDSVEFLLSMDGVDIDSLSKSDLEKAVNDSLLKELKELEYLSKPETVQAAINFANRK